MQSKRCPLLCGIRCVSIRPLNAPLLRLIFWSLNPERLQGESNVGPNDHVNDTHGPENGAEYYRCALPAMVRAWRSRLPKQPVGTGASGTNGSLPFFIVELAAYCNQNDESTFMVFCDSNTTTLAAADYHLPEMRIAQAAVLANDSAAYLASAMDLGALHPLPYASIHPTNKQALAQR